MIIRNFGVIVLSRHLSVYGRRFFSSAGNNRISPLGIQLLPESVRNYLFGAGVGHKHSAKRSELLELAREHLRKQDLLDKPTTITPYFDFTVPPLEGKDLEEHFQRISRKEYGRYADIAAQLSKFNYKDVKIPSEFEHNIGWTMYKNGSVTKVDHPLEDGLIFDVEVLQSVSKYPTLAVALSTEAIYVWLSPVLFSDNPADPKSFQHLISFGDPSQDKLVVGHNVGYDRARIKEEYDIRGTKFRYLDTLSLHMAVRGLNSNQRALWTKIDKEMNLSDDLLAKSEFRTPSFEFAEDMSWFEKTSPNSLKSVVKFYLNEDMDKSARDVFVDGSLDDLKRDLQNSIKYCVNDVVSTQRILTHVFPAFFDTKIRGNMVSFAGFLEMGSSYLPISNKWQEYIETCDSILESKQRVISEKLKELADQCLKSDPELRETDVYLEQLDWDTGKTMRLQPKWYRQLKPTQSSASKLTIRSRVAPILLRLKWMGYPVVYLGRSCGWCFRVPKEESSDSKFDNLNPVQETEFIIKETKSNTEPSETVYKNLFLKDMDKFVFYRMPSNNSGKDSKTNCGSPFAKMFVNSFDEGKMDAEDGIAKEAISANAECSYWISARERIKSQFVVWNNGNPEEVGAIIPPVIAMGTVTRRAVESTWLTASNAKKTRIGSELKTMVRPPEGYVIIGADVDSQELWIASLLGDAQFGFHGATGFGWMTLQGSKKDGTDLHSKSAAILKASRDHAKIFNYARIYGSGLKFSASLLCKCNPSVSAELAAQRAQDLYAKTKGLRYFPRRDPVFNLSGSSFLKNKFSRAFWYGGSESYMFNSLEDVANSSDPRTPVLKCQLPDSLMPVEARKKYSTSCINWVVQSSGVDYLHLLLVSVKHLASQYDIRMRLMLTIHDEVRFLVAEEDALRACYALQISNMWTRALFAKSVGMSDLPWSVAFFSSVEVDKVLRKEASDLCITPSNPKGVDFVGQSYTMQDLVDKNVQLGQLPQNLSTTVKHLDEDQLTQVEDYSAWIKCQMASDNQELRNILQSIPKLKKLDVYEKYFQ